jgi:gliding motility-associated protein GldM
MGHGKETPRQKMIGMMYLVLTSMLALNVSKEVLDAFVLVDEGLSKTTENFVEKNRSIYDDFDRAYAENKTKVEPWKQKSDKVKSNAQSLYDMIQNLKIRIIKKADGEKTEAIKGNTIIGKKVASKDNNNIPAEIMVGSNNTGESRALKKAIDDFRDLCLSFVDEKDKAVQDAIKKNLDTSDPPSTDISGEKPSWASEHFEHLPLIAVTTLMSKMQSDVRNAELEILRYLYGQIEAGSFKFNKLEATVIPNSNYIIKGNEYNAQVFLAAFDTTQKPSIYLGDYEPDGEGNFRMKGRYDSIPIGPDGKGKYVRRAGSVGEFKWGGIIKLRHPKGGFISRPFKSDYRVAEASLVISPTKMNVFYLGVDNPVEISVPGVGSDKISASISNGVIKKEGTGYIVIPGKVGNCVISVLGEIEGKKMSMGTKDFRVKELPDPVAKVAGSKGGKITKSLLKAQIGVIADIDNFDFDLKFTVVGFKVSTIQKGFLIEKSSANNKFTSEQLALFDNLNKQSKVYIEEIEAIGPDGRKRKLPPIIFKIE